MGKKIELGAYDLGLLDSVRKVVEETLNRALRPPCEIVGDNHHRNLKVSWSWFLLNIAKTSRYIAKFKAGITGYIASDRVAITGVLVSGVIVPWTMRWDEPNPTSNKFEIDIFDPDGRFFRKEAEEERFSTSMPSMGGDVVIFFTVHQSAIEAASPESK
jgi:hypothetical protein